MFITAYAISKALRVCSGIILILSLLLLVLLLLFTVTFYQLSYNPTSSVIKKGLPHLKMTRSKCDSCSINGSAAANRSDETSQVSSISKNHSIVAKGREKTIQVPLSECEKCLIAKRNYSALGKRGDTIGPFVTHIVCPECRKHIQLPVSNPEILLTVKTTEIFHRNRLSLLLFTWMQTVEPDQVKLLIMLAISVKIHQKM